MIHRTSYLATLLVCFCLGMLNTAYAKQNDNNVEQKNTPNTIYGKVTDIIDTAGYTYAEIDTGEKKLWAAGPVTPLKKGDMIAFPTRMPMKNFHSKSLQRDFQIIYFVDHFLSDNETPLSSTTSASSANNQSKKKIAKVIKAIDKVKGGNTIAEIYTEKNNLKGKTIRVRGQVTKYTPKIMGKNWFHIRDNSTTNDLTITTDNKVEVDDIVIIEGKLELDKDFGYGYVYPLIVENARIE